VQCNKCGKVFPNDSSFCPSCGAVRGHIENAYREFVILETENQPSPNPKTRIRRKLIAALVTIVLMAILIPLEILLFNLDKQSTANMQQWPTVSGIVTVSDKEFNRSEFFGDIYDLRIVYEYQVRGVTYHGNLNREVTGEKENLGLPLGKTIPVYYDPAKPSRAYIRPGPSDWVFPLFIIPMIFIIGCMLIWVWASSRWIWSPSRRKHSLLRKMFPVFWEEN
jgi:hypothetical protein